MQRLAISVVIALTWLTMVTSQLPCDSVLRRLPEYAHYFTHCECSYSEWTEWEAISSHTVNHTQCSSGTALTMERRQIVVSGECDDISESNIVCEPNVTERLIIALGLGSGGHQLSPEPTMPPSCLGKRAATKRSAYPGFPNLPTLPTANTAAWSCLPPTNSPPRLRRGEQVCLDYTVDPGRRSVREEMKRPLSKRRRSTAEPETLPVDPTPFNIIEHGARYRRQANCQLGPDEYHYILFVLDTSGSVGSTTFNRVTALLSQLTTLFCEPIKSAVMTFDHEYFVEFCFDKHNNTPLGRFQASEAIRNIQYIREGQGPGTRWTHTAGAAQCVCNYMLTSTCGLPVAASCIDVVFITDGYFNDPSGNICDEIRCLHNCRGVNTFAIGYGGAYMSELECMVDADLELDDYHVFDFLSLSEFVQEFQTFLELLFNPPDDGTYYCVNPTINPNQVG